MDYQAVKEVAEAQGYPWAELFPLVLMAERGIVAGDQEWQRKEMEKDGGGGGGRRGTGEVMIGQEARVDG